MLKRKIDKATYDGYPDEMKALYVERGDGYERVDSEIEGITAPESQLKTLRQSADRLTEERNKLRDEFEAFKQRVPEDFDPEQWARDREAAAAAERNKTRSAQEHQDALKKALDEQAKKLQKATDTANEKLAAEKAANKQLVVNSSLKAWVGKNIDPRHQDTIYYSLLARMNPEVEERGDERVAVVKDVTTGASVDMLDWLKDTWSTTDDAKNYMLAPDNSGGGKGDSKPAPPAKGGDPTVSSRKDLKTPADQAAYIVKHGEAAFLNLPPG